MTNQTIPKRSEVPEEMTWNLKDMFASDEAWMTEYEAMKAFPAKIAAFQGTLARSAGDLLAWFRLQDEIDQLLGTDGMLVAQAAEQYGARGAKQAQQLTDEVTGLFTGGELAQDDMDVMMQAIMDAYWLAKEKNKKYTPKKYRSKGKQD